jgi:hypothetical protein
MYSYAAHDADRCPQRNVAAAISDRILAKRLHGSGRETDMNFVAENILRQVTTNENACCPCQRDVRYLTEIEVWQSFFAYEPTREITIIVVAILLILYLLWTFEEPSNRYARVPVPAASTPQSPATDRDASSLRTFAPRGMPAPVQHEVHGCSAFGDYR